MVKIYDTAKCTNFGGEFHPGEIAQEKIDGYRFLLYINIDPYFTDKDNSLISRNLKNSLNAPHITDKSYNVSFDNVVLDGEIFIKDFATTQSVMGCTPENAVLKQIETGLIDFHVFDVLHFCGEDIRGYKLIERLEVVRYVLAQLNNPHIKMVKQYTNNIEKQFDKIVSDGGEGIVLKHPDSIYGEGWQKVKKSYEATCFVSGFTDGKGQFDGMVGALELSVYGSDGSIVSVGKASGFNIETRQHITDNKADYLGRCLDVDAMKLTANNKLYQPRFNRWRDDYSQAKATLTKLHTDLNT